MAGPSSCALLLGMATATAWEPFEWLVRAAPRRATYSDLLGLWPPMKWDSGAGQPGGAAQREGAGLPGQGDGRQGRKRLQHGTPRRSGPRRSGPRRSPPPAAAAPGGPRPRRTEAPPLGRKQEVPPRGDRSGSPAPRSPHPPATPPPPAAAWTWLTDNVRSQPVCTTEAKLVQRSSRVRPEGLSVSPFCTQPSVAGDRCPRPTQAVPSPRPHALHCPSAPGKPGPPQSPAHNAASTHVPAASMAGRAPSPPSKGMAASCVTSVQLPRLHCVHPAPLPWTPQIKYKRELPLRAVGGGNGGVLVGEAVDARRSDPPAADAAACLRPATAGDGSGLASPLGVHPAPKRRNPLRAARPLPTPPLGTELAKTQHGTSSCFGSPGLKMVPSFHGDRGTWGDFVSRGRRPRPSPFSASGTAPLTLSRLCAAFPTLRRPAPQRDGRAPH